MVARPSPSRAEAHGTSRSRSDSTAAAPWASTAGTKSAPSLVPPLSATKAQPGFTSRLSQVMPVTSGAPDKGTRTPCTSSPRIQSLNFMTPPL